MGAFVAFVAASAVLGGAWGGGAAAPQCLETRAPLAESIVPSSSDFAPAACPAGGIAVAFRHDRALHVTRIARALAAGEVVPRYPEFGVDTILPGQILHMTVFAGAARIERPVEALQPARPGQRLFVRAGDGEILSVRYSKSGP